MVRRASAVMVLGTASGAGKSTLAAALCRSLARRGVRVAPFKAQNMSLNSAATPDGLEIGRAQALQAEAAGLAPTADMNPVLIKPTSETGAQVVLDGRVWGTLRSGDYGGRTREWFWPSVAAAYERLAARFDAIVIEGAGSPAEINLRAGDIVNMEVAHFASARCVLVGDVDRGGVFAAIYGTLALLDERDRARIDGFAINRFRGDVELLRPGIAMLEELCGKPCFGVVPHLGAIGLDEEDGLCPGDARLRRPAWTAPNHGDRLRVAIVNLPHLANFTDFDALFEEPSVDAAYVERAEEMQHADLVVLPGSKDTIADLRWLRACGLESAVLDATRRTYVLGICGGMQMLGRSIEDPDGVESGGHIEGIGALDLSTRMDAAKVTVPVTGRSARELPNFEGYEIHVGRTTYAPGLEAFAWIRRHGEREERRDGARSRTGRVAGTYVHGLLANDEFRHAFLDSVRARVGRSPATSRIFVRALREARFERLADTVDAYLNIDALLPGVAASS